MSWWGSRGRSPGSSWISDILLTLKHVLTAENLQFFIFTSDYHMLKKFGWHKKCCERHSKDTPEVSNLLQFFLFLGRPPRSPLWERHTPSSTLPPPPRLDLQVSPATGILDPPWNEVGCKIRGSASQRVYTVNMTCKNFPPPPKAVRDAFKNCSPRDISKKKKKKKERKSRQDAKQTTCQIINYADEIFTSQCLNI